MQGMYAQYMYALLSHAIIIVQCHELLKIEIFFSFLGSVHHFHL